MDELTSALRDLGAADASKRLAASRTLERAARKVSIAARKEALGCRSATAALAKAFDDDDPKVAQNAVIALAEISRRYFKDDQVYPAFVKQLSNPDALTRLWAAQAAVTLRGIAALSDVAPLARDRSAKVRAEVVRALAELATRSKPPAKARSELLELAAAAAADPDRQVREFSVPLANAIGYPPG